MLFTGYLQKFSILKTSREMMTPNFGNVGYTSGKPTFVKLGEKKNGF